MKVKFDLLGDSVHGGNMKVKFDLLDGDFEGVWFNAVIDDVTGQVSDVTVDPVYDNAYWSNFNRGRILSKAKLALEECISEHLTVQDFVSECVGSPPCSIQFIT